MGPPGAPPPGSFSRIRSYLRILRVPRVAPLLATTLLARLPIGINGLAVVLFLRAQQGSFGLAGVTAGALALGNGLGAPIAARLIDRLGTRILLGLALVHAAGLAGLLVLGGARGTPAPVLVAVAVLTGVALPPIGSVLRARYPRLMGGDPVLVHGAYALDSVLTEVIFIAGPLITGALVALVAPAAALGVSAAAVALGTAAFLIVLGDPGRGRPRGTDTAPRLGALHAPGVRTLVLTMAPVGFAFGLLEVSIPAFAAAHGRPELAGLLVAAWASASAASGLVYGARPRRSSLARVHLRMALLLPLGIAPVALAASPATMALLVVPAGVFIAPLLATRNELAGAVAPPGAETEAYAWPLTALVAGVAAGAGAAGAIVDGAGWRPAVLVAVLAGAVGAALSFLRRATLRRPAVA